MNWKVAQQKAFQYAEKAKLQLAVNNIMNHDHDLNINNHDHEIMKQLLDWKVYYPETIIKKYGLHNVKEAIKRTKHRKPNIPGAYFTTVVRGLIN